MSLLLNDGKQCKAPKNPPRMELGGFFVSSFQSKLFNDFSLPCRIINP